MFNFTSRTLKLRGYNSNTCFIGVWSVYETVWMFRIGGKSVAPAANLSTISRLPNLLHSYYTDHALSCPALFIYLAGFYIFLRPFDNYIIFFFHLSLSFQSSSINPFSSISPLISSARVSLGLPRFLLPGGLHFITFLAVSPLPFVEHVHTI